MGDDGATGLLKLYEKGALTIARDDVVFGMPQKAILTRAVLSSENYYTETSEDDAYLLTALAREASDSHQTKKNAYAG